MTVSSLEHTLYLSLPHLTFPNPLRDIQHPQLLTPGFTRLEETLRQLSLASNSYAAEFHQRLASPYMGVKPIKETSSKDVARTQQGSSKDDFSKNFAFGSFLTPISGRTLFLNSGLRRADHKRQPSADAYF
jgi:hypothetical protein